MLEVAQVNFIGRKEELNTLEKEFRRDGSFVVIYGRRRIGKTTLIKEFIKDKQAFYFLATEEVESQSMKRLAGVVARVTGNSMLQRVTFTDWLDLFREIANYRPEEKKVLVIDEFPYLVKTNAAFPSILQNAWDEILKDSNVMLILCGSLLSMMQKHALSHDSPLYGRRSAQIRLKPLPFTDLYAVQGQPFSQAVEQYSVTGGVPKYLEFFEPGEDFYRQIQEVVLSKNGFLYEEPNFLLKDEVQSANSYFSIIRAIADGNHKLGKIAGALGMETSSLTPYLSTLIDLDFLKRQRRSRRRIRRSPERVSTSFQIISSASGSVMSIPTRESWNWTISRSFWTSWRRTLSRNSLPSPTRTSARISLPPCAGTRRWTSCPPASAPTGSMTSTAIWRSM